VALLKAYQLPVKAYGHTWSISPFTGNLLLHDEEFSVNQKLPSNVLEALDYCNHPYKLKPLEEDPNFLNSFNKKDIEKLTAIYKRIAKIGSGNFFLSCLYAGLKHKSFDDSSRLISLINHIQSDEQKSSGCLQKSLCVAKLSRSFKKSGVLFVGALLPIGQMHAWVIENGIQPDANDRGWINYRPMLALVEE
jgi:hypothetical protein